MKPDRIKRVNERILRELGTGLYRIAQGSREDVARLSFVEVRTAPDLHTAVVTVSVLGSDDDERRLLSWLRANRAAFQAHVARTVGLKFTPVLSFKTTRSIENASRVLGILDELAASGGGAAPDPGPDAEG